MSSTQHRCVFVGNIPYDASEEELIRICEEVGPVVSFRLVLDRDTGKPKGYGFCEYRDEETALSARRNLQGYDINGRQLRVDFAENEKGSADRNREQVKGRGGPGLVDVLKQTGGPKVVRDASLYQPVGLPAAVSAATVMASLLGAPQLSVGSIAPMGAVRPPMGIDSLTIHLAGMSKHQLYEVLNHMKNFIQQNQQQAHQVLTSNPQLVKALFQAQIILGWVPQVPLQTLQTQQPSMMSLQQGQAQQVPTNAQLQQGLQQPQTHRGQSFPFPLPAHLQQQASARTGAMLIPPQPLPPPPSSSLSHPPLNLAMQHRPQAQLLPHLNPPPLPNQVRPLPPPSPPRGVQAAGFQHTFSQSANLPQIQQPSGVPPNMAFLGVPPPLPNQPPPHLLQVPRSIGDMGGNGNIAQGGVHSTVGLLIPTSGGITQFGRAVGAEIPATSAAYTNWNPLPASSGSIVGAPIVTSSMLVTSMPVGLGHSNMGSSNNQQGVARGPPFEGPGVLHSQEYSQTAMQLPSHSQQLPSQQQTQVSLEPEQQKALLQQVMNLTPEQINSLPPEQRQQVLDLQQAFRNQII